MKENLFRQKSMDKITSPEQLNDYIKVANPGIWMILSGAIVFLFGVFIWGFLGEINTVLDTVAVSKGGETVCYIRESDIENIDLSNTVIINDNNAEILKIGQTPMEITEGFDSYALHISGFEAGEWVYELRLDSKLYDGVYEAKIITESVAPISFLLN